MAASPGLLRRGEQKNSEFFKEKNYRKYLDPCEIMNNIEIEEHIENWGISYKGQIYIKSQRIRRLGHTVEQDRLLVICVEWRIVETLRE